MDTTTTEEGTEMEQNSFTIETHQQELKLEYKKEEEEEEEEEEKEIEDGGCSASEEL